MVYQAYGGTNNPNPMTGDQNRKIFLGGLSYHTTDETLRAFCSRFGKITDCLVMRNPEGKSRGFGFVTYEDTSSVEDFMRSRPHTIDNRQIDPKRAMPREEQNSSEAHLTVKKLFVAGLREGINEDSLRQYFSRFGNIVEVLVMKDRDGKPRGFAFVTFDDYDAVDKAVLEKPHIINGRNLDVKKAVPKEKMQEESITNSPGGGTGMSSFNRNNPSNYSGANTGPPPPPPSSARNSFGPMRDNFNAPSGSWDNQGGMSRMNNQNQNYNQPSTSSYGQQSGYNTNASGFNPPMPPTNTYPQTFNPMGQNQPPPPPPPPLPQQPSMMNYDMYSNTSNMPFNNNPNQAPTPNYMQPPPLPYGQNQQQGFGNNPNNFGGMNDPFNLPQPPSGGNRGYNNPSSSSTPFDNTNSYGITSQSYGGGNYNMPQQQQQQQSRGGGPMRPGRGGGSSGNYGGPSGGDSGYSNRSTPYSARGGRGGRGGGGRGRGRGQ
ncbi:unnamed protein product [Rotaria sordida]|uniref:RRM domain-containing protein n=1 Tax=Rotaria sordida TaxID=392033 RepID=A0A815C1M8_9BILA|nr:unnamed protein product [Rotaria sordida]CAF1277014.1 unnamed protein product [Rotaria sordida]CAF1332995.1 unnamed protein product [Rotaria sordida]CAF3674916.1 unnamed protein product [Rotaria sordida]CAF3696742.1 unnamed protein product [Rotaria sordida]